MLAGFTDGAHHQTVGQAQRAAGGIKRTAEGLHAAGPEAFAQVGDEIHAVYSFAKITLTKLVSLELTTLDNPFAQVITTVVSEYVATLPEWVIEDTLKQNALKFPETIDGLWAVKSLSLGLIENTSQEDLHQAVATLNAPAQRLIGKQLGKKAIIALCYVIASQVTKKLIAQSAEIPGIKRDLVKLRKVANGLKGGLAGSLLTLLSSQGHLNRAAEASRRLEQTNPRIWRILRYKLNGANMVYFLVENMVSEYIDRLSLLERNPGEFKRVMAALIKARKTQAIFFPGIHA